MSGPQPALCYPPECWGICLEIYQKLRAMFPNLDQNYIKQFCPANWDPNVDRDGQFGNIVDTVLANEASWQLQIQESPAVLVDASDTVVDVEETCEYLTGIFPNAHPLYLRKSAARFKHQNDVKDFVHQMLRKSDYPTREQYMAELKITEEQLRYTKKFNVPDFLEVFPDPFQYFEDPNRKCLNQITGFEFLKNLFSRILVAEIMECYTDCAYNLSLTAKSLRLFTYPKRKGRKKKAVNSESIPLLQEMAFIRHRNKIQKYMEAKKAEEEQEFQTLKEIGGLVQCQCCFVDECLPSKCSYCENDHVFCNSCLVQGVDSYMSEGDPHVPCFMTCGAEFSLRSLQKVLPRTKFNILVKKRQAAEVKAAGLEGLVSCPFCEFASIPTKEDKVFKCLNEECMKESCITCHELNHLPLQCRKLEKASKARRIIEEKMTQAITRICYNCKKSYMKEDGCNKIVCRCGGMMCFICDKPISDYDHFSRDPYRDDPNKCPLYTNDRLVNDEAVKRVESEARMALLSLDPTLEINASALPQTQHTFALQNKDHNAAVQRAARVMQDTLWIQEFHK